MLNTPFSFSNYNTNTIFSFHWIQEEFKGPTRIFMSATIHDLQSYIEKNNWYVEDEVSTLYNKRELEK